MSKCIIFLLKSFLGNFYRHLAIFFWSHWPQPPPLCRLNTRQISHHFTKTPLSRDSSIVRTSSLQTPEGAVLFLFYSDSVTRFGDISPIWQNFTSLWQSFNSLFLIWKMMGVLRQIWNIIWLIFIVANGQLLKNNLTIWLHCIQTWCISTADGQALPQEPMSWTHFWVA